MTRHDVRTVLGTILLCLLVIYGAYAAGVMNTGALDRVVIDRAIQIGLDRGEWVNKWMGLDVGQFPGDLVTYQNLIFEVKPDVVIECGTYRGGLTVYLATILKTIRPECKILTVDVESEMWEKNKAGLQEQGYGHLFDNIEFFHGSSTDPKIFEQIAQRCGPDKKVLVILDSLHTTDHVLEELKLYSKLVTKNSYLVVNDTIHEYHFGPKFGPGPYPAVLTFMRGNADFIVDRERERTLFTCAPYGFLKRVK